MFGKTWKYGDKQYPLTAINATYCILIQQGDVKYFVLPFTEEIISFLRKCKKIYKEIR